MRSFRWDLALTDLTQRLPDLTQQSDTLPLLAQQVQNLLASAFGSNLQSCACVLSISTSKSLVGLFPQAQVDSAAMVNVLTQYLLRPDATLLICSCFRPVLLQLANCLHDQHHKLADSKADLYYIAQVQILELAPHLEQ